MRYTTVVGVDKKHLEQLAITFPTWVRHKPDIAENPILVFYDSHQVTDEMVADVIDPSKYDLGVVNWPFSVDRFNPPEGETITKWNDPQRYKMLSGFVHVPGHRIDTDYWLKLDTDTIATGVENWIDEDWFEDEPAIVGQKWHFTKPADQMVLLDEWAERNQLDHQPLNLHPNEGWSRIRHSRIISWCCFFCAGFTRMCSDFAIGQDAGCTDEKYYPGLPVQSQDGYCWYLAKRYDMGIKRVDFKSRGWVHRSSMQGIREAAKEAMK